MLKITIQSGTLLQIDALTKENWAQYKTQIEAYRERITKIEAEGNALDVIFNRFSRNGNFHCTIPICHDKCIWRGDLATFVFDNL